MILTDVLSSPSATRRPNDPARPLGSPPVPRSTAAERAQRVRFRRALSLMAMTLVVPGSAQLLAGNRRLGLAAFRTWLVLVALTVAVLVSVTVDRDLGFTMLTDPALLGVVRLVLMALAVFWAVLFMDAWRLGKPLSLGMGHRRAVVAVNGVLCFAVAGTLLTGAHLMGVQRDFIGTMSGNGIVTAATDGRYNVLLMGGDSGAGRVGLRPDSMTVASIDADTGRTVLVSLPRNMKGFPFREGSVMDEQFPDGFDADYLNGVSTWAEDRPELFGSSDEPGIDATVMAVEGITGLDVNYWAMVNLEGFKELVDAVGGVTLNVRQPIPVGGLGDDVVRYIPTGTRELDGMDTLWYARARDGSDDYSRMARQKCVMAAMASQLSPQTVVRNFSAIADASAELVQTDLPASELDTFMSLAMKAKDEKIATLSLVPPMIDTADPDIDLIQEKVDAAVQRTEEPPSPSAGAGGRRKAPTAVTGGSLGSMSDGYAANQAQDLSAAC
ncbi:Biofilm regulatory protein A [Nocardioides aquaticus]|uniref:Biofilm regulatory protein A n=1 Tax=Nocardioides aquaticus TaxID=160826 RepID=A0ABX8EMS9_9ACTN|nr:Biofilm regulatory protein A [Nocardioides aquaticus]